MGVAAGQSAAVGLSAEDWAARSYLLAARLRAAGHLPPGSGGYIPDTCALQELEDLVQGGTPDRLRVAALAGESPWPSGNLGDLGAPYPPAARLLPDDAQLADGLPIEVVLRDHPITGEPLPRPVVLSPAAPPKALPRRPVDAVLAILDFHLVGVPERLAKAIQRRTRCLLIDPVLLDPESDPDGAQLKGYETALRAAPPYDPAKPAAWRRGIERAWPAALSLPLTIPAMVAAFKARGEELDVPKDRLAAGCRALRARRLRPNDHGAVARWMEGLEEVAAPADWSRYARGGWGRARTASLRVFERDRRRGCGRIAGGALTGRRHRCGTHGCGKPDCAARQAALAREQSWPHAEAWEDAGVPHIRVGLTVPRRRDWTPIEILDALGGCAAGVVRELARRLDCRLAARIAVERQRDGTPEWIVVLADVDGELSWRLSEEDAQHAAAANADPPAQSPALLATRAQVATDAGIRTATLWPDLTAEVQAAADTAAAKAGIGWKVTYLAPVYNLNGTWRDVHKAAQAIGFDWPEGFRRSRSSRGTPDGMVRPYADAWTKAGKAPRTRQEAFQQRRDAEDRAAASEWKRVLTEAPGGSAPDPDTPPEFPQGQGATSLAAEAREAAAEAAEAAARSARESDTAWQLATEARERARLAGIWAREAETALQDARLAQANLAGPAEQAERRAVEMRRRVPPLVLSSALDDAEDEAGRLGWEAERAKVTAFQAGKVFNQATAEARAAADAAEQAVLDAEQAETNSRLDEMTADHRQRRARRLGQIIAEAPSRAELSVRRARAERLIDGPLPAGQLPPIARRWSPRIPPAHISNQESPLERGAPEVSGFTMDLDSASTDLPALLSLLQSRSTATDIVEWLKRVGPPGLEILGRIGADGEISAYAVVLPPQAADRRRPSADEREPASSPPPTLVFDLDIALVEDPGRRLDAVRQRLIRTRRLPPSRPHGLPADLVPYADPAWRPLPTEGDLADGDIAEVLRRYVMAAIRRARVAPGAACRPGLQVATEESWRAAGISRGIIDEEVA